MKKVTLKGKKLSEYQRKVLYMISDSGERNYIIEVFDVKDLTTRYTITNGQDDFEDVRKSTMEILKTFDFIHSKILPSSDTVVLTRYFIPEKFRTQVYLACL